MTNQAQASKLKRPRGTCPICGRSVRLAKAGWIGGHRFHQWGCSGEGAVPKAKKTEEAP